MPLPDEGLIHAWLDGQLPPDEAARVEHLVASDAAWAAAAADARGVIAATSRILSALDHVPANVAPRSKEMPAPRRLPQWMKVAAAVVVVAGGSAVVLRRAPQPATVQASRATVDSIASVVPTPAPTSPEKAILPRTASARLQEPVSAKSNAIGTSSILKTRAADAVIAAEKNADVAARKAPAPASLEPTSQASTQALAQASTQAPAQTSAQALAQALVPAPPPAVVSAPPTAAGAVTEKRLATSGLNLSQVVVTGVSNEPTAKAAPPAPTAKAARDAAAEADARAPVRVALAPGSCYRLRESRTQVELPSIMRVMRFERDTLWLVPVSGGSTLRAWLVPRDSVTFGVIATNADFRRGTLQVTAMPVTCPQS